MKKLLPICASFTMVLVFLLYFTAEPVAEHPFARSVDDFTIIAHQGGNLERPDETLLALEYALAVPSDILEFDIHLSKDHHLILMHDSRVDRTTDGQGAITDLTLDELKQFNAANWWPYHGPSDMDSRESRSSDEFPFRQHKLSIATLKEVFDRFPDVAMLIEIKSTNPKAIQLFGEMIEHYQRWDKVIVASFNTDTLNQFRSRYPQAATAATALEVTSFVLLSKLGLTAFYSPKANALQVPMQAEGIDIVTPRFVTAAHQRGMQVHVWTLNTKAEMQRAIEMGVDGIITDRPKMLRRLITDQKSN